MRSTYSIHSRLHMLSLNGSSQPKSFCAICASALETPEKALLKQLREGGLYTAIQPNCGSTQCVRAVPDSNLAGHPGWKTKSKRVTKPKKKPAKKSRGKRSQRKMPKRRAVKGRREKTMLMDRHRQRSESRSGEGVVNAQIAPLRLSLTTNFKHEPF